VHQREVKDQHPELFCTIPKCLWRTLHRDGTVTPCVKHPARTRREHCLAIVNAYLRTGLTATATADALFTQAADATGDAAAFLTDAAHLALVEARRRSQDGRTRESRDVA
jgi:hypothetical protein